MLEKASVFRKKSVAAMDFENLMLVHSALNAHRPERGIKNRSSVDLGHTHERYGGGSALDKSPTGRRHYPQ